MLLFQIPQLALVLITHHLQLIGQRLDAVVHGLFLLAGLIVLALCTSERKYTHKEENQVISLREPLPRQATQKKKPTAAKDRKERGRTVISSTCS